MVFGGEGQVQPPKENGRISFSFLPSFATALTAAREVCRERDIMIIGEASAARCALESGHVDEIYLRIVPHVLGKGIRLFDSGPTSHGFRPTSAAMTDSATHIHLAAI